MIDDQSHKHYIWLSKRVKNEKWICAERATNIKFVWFGQNKLLHSYDADKVIVTNAFILILERFEQQIANRQPKVLFNTDKQTSLTQKTRFAAKLLLLLLRSIVSHFYYFLTTFLLSFQCVTCEYCTFDLVVNTSKCSSLVWLYVLLQY